MMIFYTTSQDYPRLKQLLDKGYEIVCFSLKSKECALAKKQTFCDGQNFDYNFGCFHIFDHDLEEATFEQICELYDVEFIEPDK
ncbi:hypothetical protein [Paraprevotella clara]|uniref:hypothetical protein n=1 Tax=Paraprevotella clara TaxID=454154 RepID=UPI004028FE1C